ncbi:MAG: hypothetical protein WDZ79_01020 [Candidatus Paceibacterota bacterium]
MKNVLVWGGVGIIVLVVGFFALNGFIYNQKQAGSVDPTISSYEECVDAGYPSLESYPEQCKTPDGKHFVRRLPESDLENVTTEVLIEGEIVCLKHWDTSGPQTLECALGLEEGEGTYYALSGPDSSEPTIGTIPTNTRVEVRGRLVPGSSERYQTIGTIEVEGFSLVSEQ